MAEDRDPRLLAIAQSLLRRTKTGKISWERVPTNLREIYVYSTVSASVELTARDNDNQPPFVMRLLDSSGAELERLESETWRPDPLDELYAVVRKRTLQVDEKIDLLLSQLVEEEGEEA